MAISLKTAKSFEKGADEFASRSMRKNGKEVSRGELNAERRSNERTGIGKDVVKNSGKLAGRFVMKHKKGTAITAGGLYLLHDLHSNKGKTSKKVVDGTTNAAGTALGMAVKPLMEIIEQVAKMANNFLKDVGNAASKTTKSLDETNSQSKVTDHGVVNKSDPNTTVKDGKIQTTSYQANNSVPNNQSSQDMQNTYGKLSSDVQDISAKQPEYQAQNQNQQQNDAEMQV